MHRSHIGNQVHSSFGVFGMAPVKWSCGSYCDLQVDTFRLLRGSHGAEYAFVGCRHAECRRDVGWWQRTSTLQEPLISGTGLRNICTHFYILPPATMRTNKATPPVPSVTLSRLAMAITSIDSISASRFVSGILIWRAIVPTTSWFLYTGFCPLLPQSRLVQWIMSHSILSQWAHKKLHR